MCLCEVLRCRRGHWSVSEGGFVLNAEDDINWGTEAVFVAGGLVVIDWGQNTHITPTKRDCEKDGDRDSNVRVGREEHVIVLCIDCSCFHVLTHPRDHWEEKKGKQKKKQTMSGRSKILKVFSSVISKYFMHDVKHTSKLFPLSKTDTRWAIESVGNLLEGRHLYFTFPLFEINGEKRHRRLPFKPKKKRKPFSLLHRFCGDTSEMWLWHSSVWWYSSMVREQCGCPSYTTGNSEVWKSRRSLRWLLLVLVQEEEGWEGR